MGPRGISPSITLLLFCALVQRWRPRCATILIQSIAPGGTLSFRTHMDCRTRGQSLKLSVFFCSFATQQPISAVASTS
jgi:hypothetical protein